jgi:hypothetical protein
MGVPPGLGLLNQTYTATISAHGVASGPHSVASKMTLKGLYLVGVLQFCPGGILCVGGAATGSRRIIKLFVAKRPWVMAALTALVVVRLVPAVVLVVGLIDLASAEAGQWRLMSSSIVAGTRDISAIMQS